MTRISELKAEARREEAAGNHRRAIQLYLQALDEGAAGEYASPDPGLAVRIADLHFREGDPARAIEYYREAADLYAEQGLITNAIAVCNKILRVFPYEVACYRTMAMLHLEVGLVAEARKNLFRYIDTMTSRGELKPARQAVQAFVDRVPDEEAAERLAVLLKEEDRPAEALAALEQAWLERSRKGQSTGDLEARIRQHFPDEDPSTWTEAEVRGSVSAAESVPEIEAEPETEPEPLFEPELEPESEIEAEPEPEAEPLSEPEPLFETEPETDAPVSDPPQIQVYQYEVAHVRGEEDEEALEEVWPNRLELVGQYRELMSRARDLAAEFGREPTAWSAVAEVGTGFDETGAFPEIESGGPMSEPMDDGQSNGASWSASSGAANGDAFGTGWDTWPDRDEEEEEEVEVEEREERAMEAAESEDHATEEASVLEEETVVEETMMSGWDATESMETMEETGVTEETATEPSAEPPGASAFGHGAEPTGTGAAPAEVDGRPGADEGGAGDAAGQLGEQAELRRGLELLDELLELSPENLDLRRRKVAYARRLGDTETLRDAYVSLATGLADGGSRRGARILFQEVLDLAPGDEAAEAGLARLDALELQEQRRRGPRARDLPTASASDREARQALGDRLWNEFEMTIRELPWLHAATQSFQAAGADRQPALETFQMMAHYFMARDRYDEAAAVLEAAVDLSERSDQELADVLYYLGVARQRTGDEEGARELFDRVAAVDEGFRESLDLLEGA